MVKFKHTYSFFSNEQECVQAILDIHNNGNPIELDPMYNQGMFYKELVQKPKYRFDINADKKGYDAVQGDATNLPIKDNTIRCIMLDPPFMFGAHGSTDKNVINKRYTMFDTYEEMESCYKGILSEAYRVLGKGGICIFKCQDYTDSKTTMTHCLVYEWAKELGFYAKDIAILNLDKDKIFNGNLQQRHLRKTHCYFWVFQKVNGDADFEIATPDNIVDTNDESLVKPTMTNVDLW